MRVTVHSTLGGLARDLDSIAAKAPTELSKVVRRNVTEGTKTMQAIARRASGPHGKAYFKRISGDMTGPLSGEFGPHDDEHGLPVGAGWRHGHNTDTARAADVVGPKFARDVDKVLDRLFWR